MRALSRPVLAAVITVLVMSVPGAFQATPALALPGGGGETEGFGFDACTAPSQTDMNAFWTNTRFTWIGVYVGGINRACSQPNLTSSWLNNNYANGNRWRFEFLYVGLQAPCTSFANRMSSNPTTAFNQGVSAAQGVFSDLVNLGIGNNASGTPVVADMEAFDTSNSTCLAAVKAWVRGWVSQLHVSPAQVAGYYGSTCGSAVDAMWSLSPRPDFIHGADYDLNPPVSAMACVASSHWVDNRLKQYQGGHNETHNGVTLNIDSDCANGPTAAGGHLYPNSSCLTR